MRILLFILLFTISSSAWAQIQIQYEDCYPEKDLQAKLQQAKTPAEQLYAAGFLAVHYKRTFRDSLAAIYLKKINRIAESAKDKNLVAAALWWNAYSSAVYTAYDEYEIGTAKANHLLQFARQNNLPKEQIAAYLLLCDLNLHANLALAEHFALTAKQLLDNWKVDTTRKDSLKLEVFFRLSHSYIHKKDGVNIARYLLPVHDYAEQNRNEALSQQATWILAYLYWEWKGQDEKAIFWREKLCDICVKTNQRSVLIMHYPRLAQSYARVGNMEKAKYYFAKADKLRDTLAIYTLFTLFELLNKEHWGLITREHALHALNTNFNNHLFLPPAFADKHKAILFLKMGQADSAGFYLAKAKREKYDSMGRHFSGDFAYLQGQYHLLKKEYSKAIGQYKVAVQEAEERGDRDDRQVALLGLTEAYKGTQDYKNAYDYLGTYYRFKDSLSRLNYKEEIALMELQKQKQLQDAAFRERQRAQEEEQARVNYKNRVRLLALIAGLALLLLVAAFLYRNNRQKQKNNALLQQKNIEIEKQRSHAEEALKELKATQVQLIQREKMASLGELTAGIAHEIQNPLNFINNFSDVNKELIEELEQEADKGNMAEVKAIAQDVKENEQKINHHGKRADAIVKGMLQHSRSTTGEKEAVEINALTDEYLKLSYHGMRAKEKGFNAVLETHYDATIGKINAVPQDLGRVLLNLFNNAFYAVSEKKRQLNGAYEPEVSVSTKQMGSKIEIHVRDNGTGIPQKALDKIFQPFFTTKPTGEGTGLGLSLSYDIITKGHGGELKVNTKEGVYAEFIIWLPIKEIT